MASVLPLGLRILDNLPAAMVKPGPDGQKTYERGFPVGQKETVSRWKRTL